METLIVFVVSALRHKRVRKMRHHKNSENSFQDLGRSRLRAKEK